MYAENKQETVSRWRLQWYSKMVEIASPKSNPAKLNIESAEIPTCTALTVVCSTYFSVEVYTILRWTY